MRGSSADIYVGRRLTDLLEEATKQSKEFKDEYVSSEHLLLALVGQGLRRRQRARSRTPASDKDALLKALAEVRGTQRVTDPRPRASTRRSTSTRAT